MCLYVIVEFIWIICWIKVCLCRLSVVLIMCLYKMINMHCLSRVVECNLLVTLPVVICTVSFQVNVWSPLKLKKFNLKCQFANTNIFLIKFGQKYKLWKQIAMMSKQHSTLDILFVNVKFIFLTFLFQQLGMARLSCSMHACICPSCFHTS